ncbi:glycosyltransferase [bacterium]|nr:glycosyltransferase [bacterium]
MRRRLLAWYGLAPCPNWHFHPVPLLLKRGWLPNSSGMLLWTYRFSGLARSLDPKSTIVFTRQTKICRLVSQSPMLRRFTHVHEVHDLKDVSERGPDGVPGHWEYYEIGRAHGVVCVPAPCVEILRRRIAHARPILWLPNGGTPDPDPWSDWEKREGVLYVGSLFPYEGFGTLLDVMQRLPEGRLTVVGGHPESALAAAKARADEMGVADRVNFVGFVPPGRVREYLRRALVVVAPLRDNPHNRWTMCPMKLIQYMGSGAAMVVPRFPTTEPLLAHPHEALLVRPDDPAALAAAVGRLLGEREWCRKMAEAACRRALAYSWPARAQKLVRFFDAVIAQRAARP